MLNTKVRKMKLVAQVVTQHIEIVKQGWFCLGSRVFLNILKHSNSDKLQIGDIEILMYTVGFNTSKVNISAMDVCTI